jgi:hypothetical protein
MSSLNRSAFGDHRDPSDELLDIFGQDADEHPAAVDRAVTWGRGVLAEADVSPRSQVSAIAALRRSEPRLGLKSATYLAELLAG